MAKTKRDAPFSLMLVVPLSGGRHFSLYHVVEQALRGGVDAVQLRDKQAPEEEVAEAGEELARLVHNFGGRLFINSFVDAALSSGADGLHLVSKGVDYKAVKKKVGSGLIIGASSHSVEEAAGIEKAGLDYAIIGPIYPTPSKVGMGEPLGVGGLAEISAQVNIPLIAIGGITPKRVPEVVGAGASGVAVMGYILNSREPDASARWLREALIRQGK